RCFRRRKGKKKASSPVQQETFEFLTTVPLKKGKCRSQITFNQQRNLCNVVSNSSMFSKLSSSLPSLASASNLIYYHHIWIDIISVAFIRKLESVLQRAYQLQQEFEGALGMTNPSTRPSNDKHMYLSIDSISIASTDSFVSAAEVRGKSFAHALGSLCHHPFYEDALQMAEEGKISCRVKKKNRSEMLECLRDTDFQSKLHCIQQTCHLKDSGKGFLSHVLKRFEKVFEEMICFLEKTEHWEKTEIEFSARGVRHMKNKNKLCFKYIRAFSPVLAWGFLGPKSSLHDFCCFFKISCNLMTSDIFDLDKVRNSSLDTLAEDILHLLHRCSELGTSLHLLPSALREAQVQ
uniref:Mitoguardin 1 n=1 Tax=Cyprinus carpio carpio TaxID=630221 RepID=A0A9J7Z723_CYPCA